MPAAATSTTPDPGRCVFRLVVGILFWTPTWGMRHFEVGVIQIICDRLAGPFLLALFALTATGAGIRLVDWLNL